MENPHPNQLLIASITPYFLEKGNVWFEEHRDNILRARESQPFFQDQTELLERNTQYPLSQLLRRLDELGYEKVFEIAYPGEFSRQGGTVQVFPVNTDRAWRIEFLGNAIEEITGLPLTVQDEEKAKDILKKRLLTQKLFSDLKNIKEGEYVVHLDHGVAKFAGKRFIGDQPYYVLEYAKEDRLFVPEGLERKLSRYVGFAEPKVARLSSSVWFKTKRKIREEVEAMAKLLLDLYAKRETATRIPYLEAGELEEELRESFPFQETPDQKQALLEIKEDLRKEKPMDRLVCGDVGFGKTEIALRAMALAVESGRQAALLAPTTILAHQHFQNFLGRLKNTPVNVALLSRLQSEQEQKDILEGLKKGTIDIVIGTHRLLSSDVSFHNLGLLVIDDEQRFGVKQKEKFREMRAALDVLSLSATPIPRTLYMALSSLKGVSTVQTPPEGRVPVDTTVSPFKNRIIKEAIQQEMRRKGQVYYLHNRIGTIEGAKNLISRLVPGAKLGVAHARLSEKELLEQLQKFQNREYDILIATTIIENGLDIPNVNTIIVEDATKLGLSQAHQLRGRIGRSDRKAFAYFLYKPRSLTDKAKLRLQALEEATELGAGYRLALRDMEIRGAGNILGKEQAGSVNAVGLNLYCQMLSEAVERLRS